MKELYIFTIGDETFRYSSAENNVAYGGNTYSAEPIVRNEISREFSSESASITLPYDLEPAPRYRVLNPSTTVWVTILKDTGAVLFYGRVGGCSFDMQKATATLKLVSLQGMLKTKIPSRCYSSGCGFELFDTGCGLAKENFRKALLPTTATVSEDGLSVTSDALTEEPDGYFAGGYVQSGYEASYIISHAGATVTLLFPLQTYNGSLTLYVYAGCDKFLSTCKEKFDNERNFGGFPFVPTTNPTTEGF